MRINRTTAMALAASAALVVGSGVVASAAVLDLPLFGFGGHEATGTAASPATTTPPPSVVDQTVYDDHYVTTPGPSGGASKTKAWRGRLGRDRGRRPQRRGGRPERTGPSVPVPPTTAQRAAAPRRSPRPRRRPPRPPVRPRRPLGAGNPSGIRSTTAGSAAEATDGEATAGRARWPGPRHRPRRVGDARNHGGARVPARSVGPGGGNGRRRERRHERGRLRPVRRLTVHHGRATDHGRHPRRRADDRAARRRERAVLLVRVDASRRAAGPGPRPSRRVARRPAVRRRLQVRPRRPVRRRRPSPPRRRPRTRPGAGTPAAARLQRIEVLTKAAATASGPRAGAGHE